MATAIAAPSPAPRWTVPAAAAAIAVFLVLVARFWHPVWGLTPLLQFDESYRASEIGALRSEPVYAYPDPNAYDGMAYAQLACHPLLDSPDLIASLDNPAYRARRILPSAAAWLIAAGRPGLVLQAYAGLNIAIWLVFAALLWRWLPVSDGRSWLAWAGLLFSAGALASVRLALTDLPALLLVAAATRATERGRGRAAAGWLAAAGLSRETALTALPSLLTPPWLSRSNALRAAAAVAPAAAWALYVRLRLGPAQATFGNLTWPATGLWGKLVASAAAAAHSDVPLLAWASLLALAGLGVQIAYLVVRREPACPWWRLGAAYAVLGACLGPAVWEGYPGAYLRVLLGASLAFTVLAVRRRASLGWILAGNLGVFAGVMALQYPPQDERELVAVRHGSEAALLRAGEGWAPTERHKWHIWSWSDGNAQLDLQAWPSQLAACRLGFSLRSLVPRTVIVSEDGRELWRGTVGTSRIAVDVPIAIASGSARIDFATDKPAVADPNTPGGRRLAFAVYDPSLRLP